jgi:hypothetical protein
MRRCFVLAMLAALPLVLSGCSDDSRVDLRPPVDVVADEEYAVLSAVLRNYTQDRQMFVVEEETEAPVMGFQTS